MPLEPEMLKRRWHGRSSSSHDFASRIGAHEAGLAVPFLEMPRPGRHAPGKAQGFRRYTQRCAMHVGRRYGFREKRQIMGLWSSGVRHVNIKCTPARSQVNGLCGMSAIQHTPGSKHLFHIAGIDAERPDLLSLEGAAHAEFHLAGIRHLKSFFRCLREGVRFWPCDTS